MHYKLHQVSMHAKSCMKLTHDLHVFLLFCRVHSMYTLLQDMGLAYVSVGHRPSLLQYHDTRLRLGAKPANGDSHETSTNGHSTEVSRSHHRVEKITKSDIDRTATAVL